MSVGARRALLEIFQREKEWRRAIDCAIGLQEAGAGSRQKEIAQFYCELAQDALVHMHPDDALAKTISEAVAALVRNTVMREARRKAYEVLEFAGLAARALTIANGRGDAVVEIAADQVVALDVVSQGEGSHAANLAITVDQSTLTLRGQAGYDEHFAPTSFES